VKLPPAVAYPGGPMERSADRKVCTVLDDREPDRFPDPLFFANFAVSWMIVLYVIDGTVEKA